MRKLRQGKEMSGEPSRPQGTVLGFWWGLSLVETGKLGSVNSPYPFPLAQVALHRRSRSEPRPSAST